MEFNLGAPHILSAGVSIKFWDRQTIKSFFQ
jgi:hypothetical protein